MMYSAFQYQGLLLLLVFLLVFGFTGYAITRFLREWTGVWRGKRVHITLDWKQCQISIDGQRVNSWRRVLGFGRNYYDAQHQDEDGASDLQLVFKSDSNGSVSEAQLVIDGEIVQLVEAPRDKLGRAISGKLTTIKVDSEKKETPIKDPRYAAALRLFEAIQAEVSDSDPAQQLLQELQAELKEHLLIAQRLIESKENYVALGNDAGRLDLAQSETEERIQLLLAGLQDIHLAVIQRNIASSEPLFNRVQQLLFKLHADVEVESQGALKKSLYRKASEEGKDLI